MSIIVQILFLRCFLNYHNMKRLPILHNLKTKGIKPSFSIECYECLEDVNPFELCTYIVHIYADGKVLDYYVFHSLISATDFLRTNFNIVDHV